MRLLFKIFGSFALLLLLPFLILELAISVWFKHEVINELKEIANDKLESAVYFDNIKVTALGNFPNLTISILGLSIKEHEYEILFVDKITLQAGLFDIYSGNYSLSRLEVLGSKFYAPIDSTGQKFMIKAKKQEEASDGIKLLLDIPKIEIRDALIISRNAYKQNKIRISIDSGLFSLKSFDDLLEFKGGATGMLDTMISKGNLNQTAVPIAAHQSTFRINTLDNRKLFDGILQLHDAQLRAYGLLKPTGNGNLLDITLTGDEAQVNEYLTLIPQINALNFNQHNPDARLRLTIHNSGFVDPITYPNFDVIFEVKDAVLSRDGLPGMVDNVNFRGYFSNGKKKSAETSELMIDFGRAKVDDSFFEIRGSIRNFNDPYVDFHASSKVRLEDMNDLVDSLDIKMSGTIEVLANLEGKLSELEQMRKSKKRIVKGHIIFDQVGVSKKSSDLKIERFAGLIEVKNSEIKMSSLSGYLNDSRFAVHGSTKNFMPFLVKKEGTHTLAHLAISLDHLYLHSDDLQSTSNQANTDVFRFPEFLQLNCQLKINEFRFDKLTLKQVNIVTELTRARLGAKQLNFNFPYGSVRSSFDLASNVSGYALRGQSIIALKGFDTDSIKKYYNTVKPARGKAENLHSGVIGKAVLFIEKFSFAVSAPQVTYQHYKVTNLTSDLYIRDNRVRLNFANFDMYEGNISLSGLIRRNDQMEVSAFCDIAASEINLGGLTSNFAGPNKEMFAKQHFKGKVGVNGQILFKYNDELVHQENEMLGKVNLSLVDGELIQFTPITESLKFIKQANRDTILLANPRLQVLLHNDEIILPTTTFRTSLSNIEFSGYHSTEFDFGFDLQISVGDLLFKSQKKKRAQVQSDKNASFGAIKHYLQARSEDGKMNINSMKKKAYQKDLNKLKNRYNHVDSVLNQMSLQIVQ